MMYNYVSEMCIVYIVLYNIYTLQFDLFIFQYQSIQIFSKHSNQGHFDTFHSFELHIM